MANLTAYLAQTRRLLHDQDGDLYSTSDLTVYINSARMQCAAEGRCIQNYVSYSLAGYDPIRGIKLTDPSLSPIPDGCTTPIFVRLLYLFPLVDAVQPGPVVQDGDLLAILDGYLCQVDASGETLHKPSMLLNNKPFEWFVNNCLANGIAVNNTSGLPNLWAQQMSGVGGTLFFWPQPNAGGYQSAKVNGFADWLPAELVTDASIEAIPYPWTDSIPYYAAYMAYTSSQRTNDATQMFSQYQVFIGRARQVSTPTTIPPNFQTSPLSLSPGQGARNAPQ